MTPEQAVERMGSMPEPDSTLEARIAARPAPKVTPADIEAQIEVEVYIGGADSIKAQTGGAVPAHLASLELLTICILILRNGFTVTGESACASPANFDAQIGREVARKAAVAKCWPLLGYQLRTQLSNQAQHPVPESADGDE